MRITINTFGTRGDVQPYIALGLGLKLSGHTVRIVSHRIFESFIKAYQLDFYPIDLDPREVLINQSLAELGNNTLRITRWMKENFRPVLREIFTETLMANQGTELMVNSALSLAGWHVAEKSNIPAIAAFLWPMTPSRHLFGAIGKLPPTWLPFKGLINYYSTKLFNQLFYNMLLPAVNECRQEILNLRPMRAREYWDMDAPQSTTPIIYAYSPIVVPKPPDWGLNQQICGYWFLNTADNYQPPKELSDFLAGGSPPVYIGFGSMVDHEQEKINLLIINAIAENNCRAILLGGWGKLGSGYLPDSILRIDAVPHDYLFPRVAIAIHHGGAGTTAAGFRAGIPNIVVPSFGDQFFWGWQVHKLGVGPKPIPRKRLTIDNLARAIRQVINDDKVNEKAAGISRQIQTENGVDFAVGLIEKFARLGKL